MFVNRNKENAICNGKIADMMACLGCGRFVRNILSHATLCFVLVIHFSCDFVTIQGSHSYTHDRTCTLYIIGAI